MHLNEIEELLNQAYQCYAKSSFISDDPIQVPHRYQHPYDIEIAGFIAAMFSWGQRKIIIQKATNFLQWMGHSPYDFVLNAHDKDLTRFEQFKHRTFNGTDALFTIELLKNCYQNFGSIENAFFPDGKNFNVYEALCHFHDYAFRHNWAPDRSRKHISNPAKGSTCKRLNMYLRWMVRKDKEGIDFGIWNRIKPADLKIPLDVHVEKVARSLLLIQNKQRNWATVEELTALLSVFDPEDPVKYDFALFGMGVLEKRRPYPALSMRIS